MDKQTDGRTDRRKISPFYRTLYPIGATALLKKTQLKSNKLENYIVKQGKETADHLMPLGDWLVVSLKK